LKGTYTPLKPACGLEGEVTRFSTSLTVKKEDFDAIFGSLTKAMKDAVSPLRLYDTPMARQPISNPSAAQQITGCIYCRKVGCHIGVC
jgi:hypothetical protein